MSSVFRSVLASKQGSASWITGWLGVETGERHSARCQCVDVRRLVVRRTVSQVSQPRAQIRPTHVVSNDLNDVCLRDALLTKKKKQTQYQTSERVQSHVVDHFANRKGAVIFR